MNTAEQDARDMLERMGIESAQSLSAGDVVELANLIDAYREAVAALGGLMFLSEWASPQTADSIGDDVPEDFAKARLALDTAKRLGVE